MTIESIEQAYEAMYQSVEQVQKILHTSFYEAYIKNLTMIVDNYQVSEEIQEAKQDAKDIELLKGYYEQLNSLALNNEDKRKVTQLVLLKGSTIEPLQPNHQLTPDSIGFLIVYLMEQLAQTKTLTILDPAVGTGNLLATALQNVKEGGIKASGYGVDIDDTLLEIAALNAEWCEIPVHFYHQDGLQPLLIEPCDMVVSDLPIGYYPIDERAKDFKAVSQNTSEHSYAHHLLMEASMQYLKDDGYAFFLVPNNLLTSGQADSLKNLLQSEAYLQAVLNLPQEMFKNEQSQKSIVILQRQTAKTKQAKVLIATLPLLSDMNSLKNFFNQFADWQKNELNQ